MITSLNMSTKKSNVIVNCNRCNKDRVHYAKQLCRSCYHYLRLDKDKHKLAIKKWKEKNPNYFRDYQRARAKWKKENTQSSMQELH